VTTTRAQLEKERQRTRSLLAELDEDFAGVVDASRDSNADDEHDPEGATIAFERQQVDALIRRSRLHLLEVEQALARLEAGTYGTCERCGAAIPAARLEVRPTARTCVACA
jgi:RNA polymerase-binding transcription factor DksA